MPTCALDSPKWLESAASSGGRRSVLQFYATAHASVPAT